MSDHDIIEVKTYIPDNMQETRKIKENTENAFTALNFSKRVNWDKIR